MNKNLLRVGLVGLGTWARNGHLPVYNSSRMTTTINVAALCSRNLDKAQQWAREFRVDKGYNNFDEMLEKENLDVVVVCTPDPHHTHYVLKALDAGCHVVVEKPLATSSADCERIAKKAAVVGKKVITLYHKRLDPLWLESRNRVMSGDYGPLQMGSAYIENPISVPAGGYFQSNMVEMTNPNWFLGTHFYDLLRYITGMNPVQVSAYRYYGKLQSLGLNAEDAIKADFLFKNNESVSFLLAWNLPEHTPYLTKQGMVLHFQNGELDLDGTLRGFIAAGPDTYSHANPYFMQKNRSGWSGYGARFLEEVMYSLRDTSYVTSVELPSIESGWWATAMAEAVEQSADQGGRMTVIQQPNTI